MANSSPNCAELELRYYELESLLKLSILENLTY